MKQHSDVREESATTFNSRRRLHAAVLLAFVLRADEGGVVVVVFTVFVHVLTTRCSVSRPLASEPRPEIRGKHGITNSVRTAGLPDITQDLLGLPTSSAAAASPTDTLFRPDEDPSVAPPAAFWFAPASSKSPWSSGTSATSSLRKSKRSSVVTQRFLKKTNLHMCP